MSHFRKDLPFPKKCDSQWNISLRLNACLRVSVTVKNAWSLLSLIWTGKPQAEDHSPAPHAGGG